MTPGAISRARSRERMVAARASAVVGHHPPVAVAHEGAGQIRCPHTTRPGCASECVSCAINRGDLAVEIRRLPSRGTPDMGARPVRRMSAPEVADQVDELAARRPRRTPAQPVVTGVREGVSVPAAEAWLARLPMIADMPDEGEP